MENLNKYKILGEHQKINRINKVTGDYLLKNHFFKPMLISRDKNSHILLFSESYSLYGRMRIICRVISKDKDNNLDFPVIGSMTLVSQDEDTLLINDISVENQMRNQGIGKLMLELAEKIAYTNGYSSIIASSPVNKTALKGSEDSAKSEAKFFDKHLYLFASLGYDTDWERDFVSEGDVPVKKTGLQDYNLKYGPSDTPYNVSPDDEIFSIYPHEIFGENSEAETDITFNQLDGKTPLIVKPEEKDLLKYEKMLRTEKSLPLLSINYR